MKSQFYLSFWRSNLISRERVRRHFCKSQFFRSFWRSNLIWCERVAIGPVKSQFYRSFWRSNLTRQGSPARLQIAVLPQILAIEPHFVRKGCARTREIAILPQFLPIEPHFVRKGCAGRFANRNFAVFGDRTSFRAKVLHSDKRKSKSQFYLSFWRSNLISWEKVATGSEKSQFYFSFWRSNLILCERVAPGPEKSQFYLSFWRSNFVSCERVVFRAVSLALPRAFKREKKERARGQERM